MSVRILIGDCRERMGELPTASVDSIVCDPPYELGFMGKSWDSTGVANDKAMWAEAMRVLKPGGHLVAFSGTRTYHRMAVAIEDAGFEIRDQLAWCYGQGFPKSLDVSKAIDATLVHGKSNSKGIRAANASRPGDGAVRGSLPNAGIMSGNARAPAVSNSNPETEAARQWQGWGTALKPAWEPICLARKPITRTVASNVLAHGTGALNIDGCRIEGSESTVRPLGKPLNGGAYGSDRGERETLDRQGGSTQGRWPANIIHDGSDEVVAAFPESDGTGGSSSGATALGQGSGWNSHNNRTTAIERRNDSGSAARFFYCAKTATEERGEGNNHPTVKPIALMQWLVRLVTPKGGTVLDPFMGSGSTGLACQREQMSFIGCEMSPEYAAIAERRLNDAGGLFAQVEVLAA